MNHDIDRTQVGFAQGAERFMPQSSGSVFNRDEHTHLTSGLMEVENEQELDYFLGDVISGATSAIGNFISSPTGQALGSALKDVAKQVLPAAGTALGDYFGGPTGGQIGGTLGTAAAGLLHEAATEEQEWEAADTFVKLAGEAAKHAAETPQGGDPHTIAKNAIVEAARIHAPGLVTKLTGGAHGACPPGCRHHHHGEYQGEHHRGHYGERHGERPYHSGRWYRHGDRIVLVGI
jgi:hypothetical protein